MPITRRSFLQALSIAPIALPSAQSLAKDLTVFRNTRFTPFEIIYGGAAGGGKSILPKIIKNNLWANVTTPEAAQNIAKQLLNASTFKRSSPFLATLPSKEAQTSLAPPSKEALTPKAMLVFDEESTFKPEMWHASKELPKIQHISLKQTLKAEPS